MKTFIFTFLLLSFSAQLFATADKKQLQLIIQAPDGSYDQTTIYFDFGLTPAYNQNADGPKVINTIPGAPNLYSLTSDNVKCALLGYSPLTQSAVIGLGVLLDTTATYTFTLSQFTNFDSTTLVILEDRKLHVFTEMHTNFYQAQLTVQDTTGRFFLHVTSPVQFNNINSGCNNNNGTIAISSDSSITWNSISLVDTTGTQTINSYNNVTSQIAFNSLAEGSYNVTFNYNGYSVTKALFLKGTHIQMSISASAQLVTVGENINFYSTATNTTGYVWQYGDSTVETGVENPTFFYYTPGIYTVTLTCTNDSGCSSDAQMTITVSEPTGIIDPSAKDISIINLPSKTVQVTMNQDVLPNAELQIYNILGQSIYIAPVTAQQMQVSLSNQPSGIYLVSVKNGTRSTTTKIYIN